MLNALDGGVVNFGGGSVVALKTSFSSPIKAGVGRIEIRQADGVSWNSYAIASVEGYEDPLAQELNITLEPAEGES